MLIGLTGGIASGKSTVARMLRDHGAVVVDADLLAREVVEPGTPALRGIQDLFGDDLIRPDGSLDRARLGTIVFGDRQAREQLNAIVHPAVRELAKKRFAAAAAADPEAIIVYDVPLLAESETLSHFDLIVLADAPAEMRRQRLIDLRGLNAQEASRRVNAQASDDARRTIADVIVDTTRSLDETATEVDQLWARLTTTDHT
ncbi:dephospho-CoA kinase [Paramicrobacterium chengjingii]|uniref:Dephospho-CoA kinase n=1 Tax=Paramicrobacterium chengjingii TaxID=2769067 RepID=A0ABX6YNV8_9MICO|nr:dephospho-CoA kinase [Microbacterium chengjingii]QPZ39962.1 dephospho-CoA kinase [Microbacterium chengjingii]